MMILFKDLTDDSESMSMQRSLATVDRLKYRILSPFCVFVMLVYSSNWEILKH